MNRFALILLLPILGGCQLQSPDLSTEVSTKALLSNHSEDNLKHIKLIIAEALGMHNVRLSQSTFKHSSLLIIERQPVKFANKPQLLSETELPHHFTLLKNSKGCVIEHKQSNKQWYLQTTHCVEQAK
jgi:hypothetical protein